MPISRPSLTPVVQPSYPRFARIIEGNHLVRQAGKTYADIAAAAGRHANTISAKYRGAKGEYVVVHDCFTGLNRLTGNAFKRSDYVRNLDDSGNLVEDPALDRCLVFPRLREYISSRVLGNYREIGDSCGVKTLYIDHMRQGRPVAENLVRAYFKAVSEVVEGLEEGDELFR